MEHPISLTALIGSCVALSFLMSGMEAGVFALSRLRIRQQMRAGKHRAHLLHQYLEHPENFLWTILVGNTLAMFFAFGLILTLLYERLGRSPLAFWLSFLVIAFCFYAFCDLLPKLLFRMFPTRLCLLLVVPFRWIHLALSPLVGLITWVSTRLLRWTGGQIFRGHLFGSRAELRMAMQESQMLSSEERLMINRVLDLQNITVGSIAIPMSRVIGVEEHAPAREIIRICREHQLTRLPVWKDTDRGRRVAGLVSLRHVLYSTDFDPEKLTGAYVRPAVYLREDLRLEEALRRLQRSGQRLAIVLALEQREIGIVSLQDILRSVFGEVSL